jgi:hypothetical protein
MKRLLLGLIALQSAVFGMYSSNPADPQILDEGLLLSQDNWAVLKVGYQGDFVWDRKLRAYKLSNGPLDDFEIFASQGVVTFNALDRIEIYGTVGGMKAEFSQRPHDDPQIRKYGTEDNFMWGAGGRAIVLAVKHFALGVEGGYQWANLPVRWNTISGISYPAQGKLLYREWQVGIGFSYQVDIFTPYMAAKYSAVPSKMVNISPNILSPNHFWIQSRQNFGLSLGCTLSPQKIFSIAVEVQLFDEQAMTLAGTLKF